MWSNLNDCMTMCDCSSGQTQLTYDHDDEVEHLLNQSVVLLDHILPHTGLVLQMIHTVVSTDSSSGTAIGKQCSTVSTVYLLLQFVTESSECQ